jgi:type I restriction enzyme S subunit
MSNQFFDGFIPDGWEVRSIGSLGKVITGKTPPTCDKESFGEGYPFITPRDMQGQKYERTTERCLSEKGKNLLKNNILPEESICVSCIGSDMGKVVMTSRTSLTNQQLNCVVPENINSHFVYYALLNASSRFRNMAFQSTAVPILNKSDFSAFEIIVPTNPIEANNIAAILCSLDGKIEINRNLNRTLEAVGRAVFERWFVDFEFPNEKGKPYKSSGGEMVASELGETPKDWTVTTIADMARITLGGTPKRSEPQYWNGNNLWATAGTIANSSNLYVFETEEKITEEGVTNSNAKVLPAETIVVTARGTVGEIRLLGVPSSVNQTCYALTPKHETTPYFLYCLLKASLNQMKSLSYGTVFETITLKTFDEFAVTNPSQDVIRAFNTQVEPLFRLMKTCTKENIILSKIRDSLLPKLMSGKIRIHDSDNSEEN